MSFVALVAAVWLAVANQGRPGAVLLVSGVVAVIGSWVNVLMTYAVHYARLDARHRCLGFHDDGEREFSDYVYLAGAAQMTFGTTDVETRSATIRRVLTIHGVIAFAFNTVIVAILVSLLVR
ncbi:DUF1345 domain-containing protein [Mariniluteicoccus flavus]